jgi:hypothetical protein
MSGCLPCFGSSAKDAASKDSVKKELSAKDGSVTQSHHISLGEIFHSNFFWDLLSFRVLDRFFLVTGFS